MAERARQAAGYDELATKQLLQENIVTAQVLRLREEARRKDDLVAAFLYPRKREAMDNKKLRKLIHLYRLCSS